MSTKACAFARLPSYSTKSISELVPSLPSASKPAVDVAFRDFFEEPLRRDILIHRIHSTQQIVHSAAISMLSTSSLNLRIRFTAKPTKDRSALSA